MILADDIAAAKKRLDTVVGQNVIVKAGKGYKKEYSRKAVLDGTYSGIFVVTFVDDNGVRGRRVSFTYKDLLMGSIEISADE